MEKKSVVKKEELFRNISLFLIVNLVFAVLAFGYQIGVVSGQLPLPPIEQEERATDEEYANVFREEFRDKQPPNTPIPTATISSRSSASPDIIYGIEDLEITIDGTDYSLTEGTLTQSGGKTNIQSRQLQGGKAVLEGGLDIDQALIDKTINLQKGETYFFQKGGNYYSIEANGALKPYSNFGEYSRAKSIADTDRAPGFGKPGGWFGAGTYSGAIANGFKWAGIVGGVTLLVTQFLPEKYKGVGYAASAALSAGSFWTGTFSDAFGAEGVAAKFGVAHPGWANTITWGGGILIAAVIFYFMYKSEDVEQEIISFQCGAWDAPSGGRDCEKCNEGLLPCSEYQCRSLGQACEIVNEGTPEQSCVWVHRNDVKPPVIRVWEDALSEGYQYTPNNAVSPPDRGTKIINKESPDGCVEAFFPLTFGITTDEPSRCKVDYVRKQNFSDMNFFFGGDSLFRYNHTQAMSLPGPSAFKAENLTLQNDGEFDVYVRCIDPNGNYGTGNFVFNFCVDKGPDNTAPEIVTTNLLNGMPVGFNQSSLDLEVYVNEPAECKWSHRDQIFKEMEETMTCASSITQINSLNLYTCRTTLTGIKNRQPNEFYFRCKDQPAATEDLRNENRQSYKFVVEGTEPLVITSVSPNNETIKDSTDSVKVTLEAETAAGHEEGEAVCYYSDTGETDSYIAFFNSNSYTHSQDLFLPEGSYKYFIKCVDLGGNSDGRTISFRVDSDTEAPVVVRAFKEENFLRLITNEEASCVYDTVDCQYLFDDGTPLTATASDDSFFTDWNTQTSFYVKCEDQYGNRPLPNSCSIIARPFDVFFESA